MAAEPITAKHVAAPSCEVEGNRLELLPGGRERFDALIAMIDGATESLAMLFYMFSEDWAGDATLDALCRAAGRGVTVELLIDGFGSDASTEYFAPLREAGGRFCLFHARVGRRYLIRNHQKLVVADRQRALIGGANIDAHYLEDEGEEHWRDLWMAMDGPAAAPLADYFEAIWGWTQQDKARIRDLRRIITRHSYGHGKVTWKFSGPMRRHNPWPASIARDLVAGKRLDMIAAYFTPSYSMMRRIGLLARRGKARIVNAAKSDNAATVAAARHTYRRLLRRRVELYEYQPAKLHSKLYIIDDVVHIGSANFDFRSLYLNLEMMLRVEDPAFADAMRGFVDREIADSIAITPRLHRQRSNPWRTFKWFLSYWLVTTVDYTVTRRVNFGVE